ncbi:CAAX prenyl protease 2-like [Clytia hemisphaerica]|uniref:CAAX prenyl protease 2-like n=1 Tax=Clytia hemisphaerica TaxID=252671 RepID=UPI0034D4CED2
MAGFAIISCLVLAVSYVGSLYLTKSTLPRDHPKTIKERILRVSIVCILGPIFVYFVMEEGKRNIFWMLLGLHGNRILIAAIAPLILTIILFAGPLVLYFVLEGFQGVKADIFSTEYYTDLKWYRTLVVAPVSEELIFRACMLPLLVPDYGNSAGIFIAPLFFGVAHFHHIREKLKAGNELVPVLLSSFFQFSYTTLFGAYSAFLFLRTGHLIGPVICHAFCNMMEFPDFGSIPDCKYPKLVSIVFVLGLVLFFYCLFPMTDPVIYDSIYWS